MRRAALLAALAALATCFASAAPADASVGSASIHGTTATLNLDAANDDETISVSGGLVVHSGTGGGLDSSSDWDSATPGDQTVPADGSFEVVVDGGDGDDSITVLVKSDALLTATLHGGAGDDVLTGGDTNDTLDGGDGDDRIRGAVGFDELTGGAGDDTLVWNNGDGSDVMKGDAGDDVAEVNGSPDRGDDISISPTFGGVKVVRTNLVRITLQTATERIEVNGLGGDDSISAGESLAALTLLSIDGGAGADTITGGEGPDLIRGGAGDDVLNGGDGDDTLVWRDGDGSDVINGDRGSDDVQVNGDPSAGDVLTVEPNAGRVRLDRTNLTPFSLDVGSSETMHVNGLGGDDSITVGDARSLSVTPSGGSGDDAVDIRDNAPELARGGAGNDSVVADGAALDAVDGFETVDRPAIVVPPPPVDRSTRPVTIRGGTVKATNGVAPIVVSCPASSTAECVGSLTLSTSSRRGSGGPRAIAELGSARYAVAPAAFARARVRLVRGVRHLGDRRGRLAASAFAATGSSGAIATSSRRVTLLLGR
jgi:RTX calcium-binding nonapeptide repeat (4 copies)